MPTIAELLQGDSLILPNHAIQQLRHSLLNTLVVKQDLERDFQKGFAFRRTTTFSTFSQLLQECNVEERGTLLLFWGCERADSRGNMSVGASSCSSIAGAPQSQKSELRSIAQQTDISCWHNTNNSGATSPDVEICRHAAAAEASRAVLRAALADSLTLSSPASSVLPAARSPSILDSVCALLLKKQASSNSAKEGSEGGGGAPLAQSASEMCRICFGGASSERLVRPCACRGTVACVHRSCLERWLLAAATSYCELCRHHYVVTRTHKWSWARSLAAWALSAQGRALAADAWRAGALCACGVAGTARALHACDALLAAGARRGGLPALAANVLSSLLIGLIGALNGLLTTWMLLKVQEHQAAWRAWRDAALRVHITLRGDDDESPPPPDGEPPAPAPAPGPAPASPPALDAAHALATTPTELTPAS